MTLAIGDERLLTASDGLPLHSQARATVGAELTDGAMPAVMEMTDDGVSLANVHKRLLMANDGPPLHSQILIQSVKPRLRRLNPHDD